MLSEFAESDTLLWRNAARLLTCTRTAIAISSSSGNVGIGILSPQEALDVNGNIKLNGNIVSNGDICIGTCT